MVARRGGTQSQKSKKIVIESKDDFKDRGFSSPDEADSLMLTVHVARMNFPEFKAKARDTVIPEEKPKNCLTDDDSPDMKFGEAMDMDLREEDAAFSAINFRVD
jgi:hypothetical protein